MDVQAVLSELRERVMAAHQQRQPLSLRGAGTKDFYRESDPGPDATPAFDAQASALDGRSNSGKLASARDGRGASGEFEARASTIDRAPGHGPALLDVDPSRDSAVVDLRAYRGIIDYEPSELVITARCGTPLSEIEAALADCGQFLAFEPPAFGGDPTIGGVIAAGLSGPRRMYAGAARDFVLGATLLDARGDILRFGGQVMKNVAGFDVSRLLCGSLGILGVITEVSLKVLPRPRAEETLTFEMPARQAVEAFNRWGGQPLPLSGAAWWDGVAWLRLSGAASAVRAAQDRLGGERVDPTAATRWWNALRHCQHPIFQSSTLWRLSVPDTTAPLALPGNPLIDWGGALRWYGTHRYGDNAQRDVDARNVTASASVRSPAQASYPGRSGIVHVEAFQSSPFELAGTAEAADLEAPVPDDIRSVASAAGGTAMCWRGPAPAGGRFHPLQPTVATLTRRLKDRFDPHGIFNPGRMIAGL